MTTSRHTHPAAPDPNRPPRAGHARRALRRAGLALGAAALVALVGCGAISAQNPGGALRPVNAVALDGQDRVMLAGHDVVAYWTQGRHAKGSAQFSSIHEGVTFYFSSAEHKSLFDQNPARYLPQYGGYCANGIVYGIPWGGDADAWRIVDGRLFIFGGAGSKAAFELDIPRNTALADRYWRDEVAGANSFWQRTRRLVFRVPHYQSGEELAKAVAAAKAAPK
jgi:YHS domain-containing protein